MSQGNGISRRRLLKRATGAAAAIALPHFVSSSALGKAGSVAPSSRITLGCIGTGGMGKGDMGLFMELPDVQIQGTPQLIAVRPNVMAIATAPRF